MCICRSDRRGLVKACRVFVFACPQSLLWWPCIVLGLSSFYVKTHVIAGEVEVESEEFV